MVKTENHCQEKNKEDLPKWEVTLCHRLEDLGCENVNLSLADL